MYICMVTFKYICSYKVHSTDYQNSVISQNITCFTQTYSYTHIDMNGSKTVYGFSYHIVQNLMGENIDEFQSWRF